MIKICTVSLSFLSSFFFVKCLYCFRYVFLSILRQVCVKTLRLLVDSAFSDSQSERPQSGENLMCLNLKLKMFRAQSQVVGLSKVLS